MWKILVNLATTISFLWMSVPPPFAKLREKLVDWAMGGIKDMSPEDLKDATSCGLCKLCNPPDDD